MRGVPWTRPSPSFKKLLWLFPSTTAIAGLVIAALLHNATLDHYQDHFAEFASAHVAQLKNTTVTACQPVQHLAAMFRAGLVTEQNFQLVARSMPLSRPSWLVALLWVPKETDAAGHVKFPVRYSYAPEGNSKSLGLDLLINHKLRSWLIRASKSRQAVISPWYRAGGKIQALVVRPVFAKASANVFLGFAAGVYRIDRVVEAAWGGTDPELVGLWVSDERSALSLEYNERASRTIVGVPAPPSSAQAKIDDIDVFGSVWRVEVVAKPGTFAPSPWRALVVALGGFCISGLLVLYLHGAEKLSRREQEIEALVEGAPDIIARVDNTLRLTFVNATIERLTGRPREWFIGKAPAEFGVPHDELMLPTKRLKETFTTGREQVIEHEFTSRRGTRYFQSRLVPEFDRGGKVVSVLVIARDIADLKKAQITLEHLALHDPMTGVANRRFLHQFIEREWPREVRHRHSVGIIMVDIDHFKAYNDRYGHQKGDECLRLIATALKRCLRRPTDFLARYGGEEFAIVLLETDVAAAAQISETLRSAVTGLALPHEASPVSNIVTASFGVAAALAHLTTYDDLLSAADQALYHAKQKGRDRVVVGQL